MRDPHELVEVDTTAFDAFLAEHGARLCAVPINDARLEPGTNYLDNETGRMVAARQSPPKSADHCLVAARFLAVR